MPQQLPQVPIRLPLPLVVVPAQQGQLRLQFTLPQLQPMQAVTKQIVTTAVLRWLQIRQALAVGYGL